MIQNNYIDFQTYPSALLIEQRCTLVKPYSFRIYIPSVNQNGKIPEVKGYIVIEYCRNKLRQVSGGSTEINTLGTYIGRNNKVISEAVTLISAYFSAQDEQLVDSLLGLCYWLKESLDQESVAAEIDSKFCLI